MRLGRNAMAIWQDLVDEVGFTARYASVRRFVRQLRRTAPPRRASSSPPRPARKPRSTTARARWSAIPDTGKYRRTRLFVLTLAHSRKAVRLLTWQSSAQTWAELHERAFRRLGGTPRTVVLDNLKEGVLTPDVYEPTLNPLYRDVLAHYGVVGLPCRVGDPDRKGKVESGHRPHAEDAAPRPALRDARAGAGVSRSLGGALGRHADPRHDQAPGRGDVCRGAARAAGAAGRALSLLPLRRAHGAPRWLRRSRGRVLLDAPGWIGQRVQVQWTDLHVRLLASEDRPAAARACPRTARVSPHRRSGSAGAHARGDAGAPGAGAPRRRPPPHGLHLHPRPRGRRRRAPHPRRPRAREEIRRRPRPTTPRKRRSSSRSRPIASSAAISSAGPRRRSR